MDEDSELMMNPVLENEVEEMALAEALEDDMMDGFVEYMMYELEPERLDKELAYGLEDERFDEGLPTRDNAWKEMKEESENHGLV